MDVDQIKQNKRQNTIQTVKLVFGMAAILAVIGFALGGKWLALIAVGIALVTALFGPRVSPRLVLRAFRARPIAPHEAPELFQIHQTLCQRAGLKHTPVLVYVPSRTLNAFATGTDEHAMIAMTDGLLRHLNTRELAGVMAHEISHISHHDIRIMALADSFSRIISFVSRMGLFAMIFFLPVAIYQWQFGLVWRLLLVIAAPVFGTLVQLALSRSREFNADMGAVELTHDPAGLASALRKLERLQPQSWFRRILYPANREPESAVLRSHPHTHERIERLMKLVPQYEDEAEELVRVISRRQHYPQSAQPVRRRPSWHPISGLWH